MWCVCVCTCVESQVKKNIMDLSRVGDFPGGPVVRAVCFQCRGHRFDPWLGN